MKEFDSSFLGEDKEIRARHGKPWQPDEEGKLHKLFRTGANLVSMCAQMQRPASGVLTRLNRMGLIRQNPDDQNYYYVEKPTVNSEDLAHPSYKSAAKEPTMTAPTIETRVLINGRDATDMTDTQIFNLIGELEGKIKKLEAIEAKPKKLMAAIVGMKEDIAKLVEYVDGRE